MSSSDPLEIDAHRRQSLAAAGLLNAEPLPAVDAAVANAGRALQADSAALAIVHGGRAYLKAQWGHNERLTEPLLKAAAFAVGANALHCTDVLLAGVDTGAASLAAVPLRDTSGLPIAALCVAYATARRFGDDSLAALRAAARFAELELTDRSAKLVRTARPEPWPEVLPKLLLGDGDVVATIDRTDRIVHLHAASQCAFGQLSHVVGRRVSEIAGGPAEMAFRQLVVVALRDSSLRVTEQQVDLPAGQRVYEASSISVADGNCLVLLRDVTVDRQREAARQRRDALVNQTEQIAAVGGFDVSFPSGAGEFTRQTRRILDLPGHFGGDIWHLLNMVVPGPRDDAMRQLESAIDNGRLFDIEVPVETMAGRRIIARFMGLPEYGPTGHCERISGAVQDVTALRATEAQSHVRGGALQGIALAQSQMLLTGEAELPLKALLLAALRLTSSESGFVGVCRPSDGAVAMVTRGWRFDTAASANAEAPVSDVEEAQQIELGQVFGQPVTARHPIYCNAAEGDPRCAELPAGGVAVRSLVALPFVLAGEVAGWLVLVNRNAGYYPSIADDLDPVLQTCASIVAAQRSDADRRAATDLAREAESKWRTLFEMQVDGIVTCDADGQIESMNPSAERLFGFAAGAWRGCNVTTLMGEELRGVHGSFIKRLVDGGAPRMAGEVRELEGVRQDGTRFPLELSLSQFRIGATHRFAGVVRDVTVRKHVEAQLRERTNEIEAVNRELSQAMKLKDNFLASMSHELRTPLNAILGLSEALKEEVYGTLTDRQRKTVRTIEESGRHLLALITDILDLSKIEADRLSLTKTPIDVDELCNTSLRLVRESATRKGLQIELTIDPAVGVVTGDLLRLKQVLVNLMSNAIKFTESGGTITLSARALPDRGIMQLVVADTGIGIAEEDQARLFQPFVQLDSALSRHHEGTGLGLALVDRLVRLHGGTVELASKVGEGATFTVSLPWAPPESPPRSKWRESGIYVTGMLPTVSLQKGKVRVLVVDDNVANAETVRDYLESRNYRVAMAATGEACLDMLKTLPRAERPHAILMDVQMPGIDGLETTRQLRKMTAFAVTPVVAVTALAMPGDRERCLQAGMNEFLSKPVRLSLLHETLERLLAALKLPAASG